MQQKANKVVERWLGLKSCWLIDILIPQKGELLIVLSTWKIRRKKCLTCLKIIIYCSQSSKQRVLKVRLISIPFCGFWLCGSYSWGFIAGNRRTSWVCIERIIYQSIISQWKPRMSRKHWTFIWNRTDGNTRTLMFWESVSNIVRRSIPKPQPPVGGRPYSRAVQNVSSRAIASSSPDWRSWTWYEVKDYTTHHS